MRLGFKTNSQNHNFLFLFYSCFLQLSKVLSFFILPSLLLLSLSPLPSYSKKVFTQNWFHISFCTHCFFLSSQTHRADQTQLNEIVYGMQLRAGWGGGGWGGLLAEHSSGHLQLQHLGGRDKMIKNYSNRVWPQLDESLPTSASSRQRQLWPFTASAQEMRIIIIFLLKCL